MIIFSKLFFLSFKEQYMDRSKILATKVDRMIEIVLIIFTAKECEVHTHMYPTRGTKVQDNCKCLFWARIITGRKGSGARLVCIVRSGYIYITSH